MSITVLGGALFVAALVAWGIRRSNIKTALARMPSLTEVVATIERDWHQKARMVLQSLVRLEDGGRIYRIQSESFAITTYKDGDRYHYLLSSDKISWSLKISTSGAMPARVSEVEPLDLPPLDSIRPKLEEPELAALRRIHSIVQREIADHSS